MQPLITLDSSNGGHTSAVYCIAFHPTDNYLATGSYDRTVKLWELKFPDNPAVTLADTTEPEPEGIYIGALAFKPKKAIVFDEPIQLLSTGRKVLKLENGKLVTKRKLLEDTDETIVRSVAFHPTHSNIMIGNADGTINQCNIAVDGGSHHTCMLIPKFKPSNVRLPIEKQPHTGPVISIAFHPIHTTIMATGSGDTTIKLWVFRTQHQTTCSGTIMGHSDGVSCVAFHHTANPLLLASGSHDKTVKLWHLTVNEGMEGVAVGGTCVATLDESNGGHSKTVTSVAFHPTANPPLLATGSQDKTVKLWQLSADYKSAICVATLEGHSSWVTSVEFHPTANPPILATGSEDGTVKLWVIVVPPLTGGSKMPRRPKSRGGKKRRHRTKKRHGGAGGKKRKHSTNRRYKR